MKRRTISATELRIHLGETLRRLEDEELVIEKGGVPVAVLRRYVPQAAEARVEAEYERALARRAAPNGWERMDGAMAAGWAGVKPEELVANIYRWRDESARLGRYFEFGEDEPGASDDDAGLLTGQRRLRSRDPKAKYVADGDGETYQA